MYIDPRHTGINAYREARAIAKQKALLANEVRANNPDLTDAQVHAIVEGSLRSKEAQRTAAKAKVHTHRRSTKKRRKPTKNQFKSELAIQLEALRHKID